MRADGQVMATGSHQGSVELWDTSTCKHLSTVMTGDGYIAILRFAPRGDLLAVVPVRSEAALWSSSTGQRVQTLPFDFSPIDLVFGAQLDSLAVLTNENRVQEFSGGVVGERHSGFRLYPLGSTTTPGQ